MYDLVVVAYGGTYKAKEVRTELLQMQKEYLSEIEDAVVVDKLNDGNMLIDHMTPLSVGKSLGDTFLGNLISFIFHKPEPGDAVEHVPGSIKGALQDVGVTDSFMKELAESLRPGQSALFVMICPGNAGKVLEKLSETGGKVLHISLSHADKNLLHVHP
jgi:uncharacterized membrane protein